MTRTCLKCWNKTGYSSNNPRIKKQSTWWWIGTLVSVYWLGPNVSDCSWYCEPQYGKLFFRNLEEFRIHIETELDFRPPPPHVDRNIEPRRDRGDRPILCRGIGTGARCDSAQWRMGPGVRRATGGRRALPRGAGVPSEGVSRGRTRDKTCRWHADKRRPDGRTGPPAALRGQKI